MFSCLKDIIAFFKNEKENYYFIIVGYFIACIIALSFIKEPNVHRCIGVYSAYGLIIAEGICYFCNNIGLKRTAIILTSLVYIMCFVKFERYYLLYYPLEVSPSPYCEYDQTDAVNFITNNEKINKKITYTSADVLYITYATRTAPQIYNARSEENGREDYGLWRCKKLVEILPEYNYIVSTAFLEYAEQLRQEGFHEEKFEYYSVFYTD